MTDMRWASLGWVVACWVPLAGLGCSSTSSNDCGPLATGDASPAVVDMRPRVDGAVDARIASPGVLGASCKTSTDCPSGLTCIAPTQDLLPGEGPPNGLCTLDCTTDTTNTQICAPLGGTCVQFGSQPETFYCVESCDIGPMRTAKCHNRPDFACRGLLDATGNTVDTACLPACTDDADCGSRKCDLRTGDCVDAPATGLPAGSACSRPSDCQGGECLGVFQSDAGVTTRVCSSTCRFGGVEGCGFRRGALTAGSGACAVTQDDVGVDGDEGYCLQLCDSDADCLLKVSGWGCVNSADTRRQWGHGVCTFVASNAADAGRDASALPDASGEAASADASTLPGAKADAALSDAAPATSEAATEASPTTDAGSETAADAAVE